MNPFPTDLYEDTRCSYPLALYPSHAVYSETQKQRNYLGALARNRGYQPPLQTCCGHQVKSLIEIIQTRLPSRRSKVS